MTGPSVVAIGGGHGLSTVREAMGDRASSLVGVVSVADDGGSSGRIRRDLDIVAPGDMRRCLAALTPEGLMRDALEHRFESGVLEQRLHRLGRLRVVLVLLLQVDGERRRLRPLRHHVLGHQVYLHLQPMHQFYLHCIKHF